MTRNNVPGLLLLFSIVLYPLLILLYLFRDREKKLYMLDVQQGSYQIVAIGVWGPIPSAIQNIWRKLVFSHCITMGEGRVEPRVIYYGRGHRHKVFKDRVLSVKFTRDL